MDLEREKLYHRLRLACDTMELARTRWVKAQKDIFEYEWTLIKDPHNAPKETPEP